MNHLFLNTQLVLLAIALYLSSGSWSDFLVMLPVPFYTNNQVQLSLNKETVLAMLCYSAGSAYHVYLVARAKTSPPEYVSYVLVAGALAMAFTPKMPRTATAYQQSETLRQALLQKPP